MRKSSAAFWRSPRLRKLSYLSRSIILEATWIRGGSAAARTARPGGLARDLSRRAADPDLLRDGSSAPPDLFSKRYVVVFLFAAPPRARSNKKLRHESVILLFCAKFVTVAHKQILFFNVFVPTFVSEKRDGNLNTI